MSAAHAMPDEPTVPQLAPAADDPFFTLPDIAENSPSITNAEIDRLIYGEPESCSRVQS